MQSIGQRGAIPIPQTLGVVAEAWHQAEATVRDDIARFKPQADEEFITGFFALELARALKQVSDTKAIEQAFLVDLRMAFHYQKTDEILRPIARGLVAEATHHKRATETVTGGDFGLMIIRPKLTKVAGRSELSDYRRGLLCQAKLKGKKGTRKKEHWGSLTPTQKRVLVDRVAYLAMLLYQYQDPARRQLDAFRWFTSHGSTLQQVDEWLKQDQLPPCVDSTTILTELGQSTIGTDDDDILNTIVSPARNPGLILRITWPDDKKPPRSAVDLLTRQKGDEPLYARIQS